MTAAGGQAGRQAGALWLLMRPGVGTDTKYTCLTSRARGISQHRLRLSQNRLG
jgi:hypothetical protein